MVVVGTVDVEKGQHSASRPCRGLDSIDLGEFASVRLVLCTWVRDEMGSGGLQIGDDWAAVHVDHLIYNFCYEVIALVVVELTGLLDGNAELSGERD